MIQHHDINEANKYVVKSDVKTIITFRTQQLLDLWLNEMQGQISDGMWENSRNTDWLWRDVWLQLGDETKVENDNPWGNKRTSFGIGKELWDIVGDRIMDESGFENKRQAVAAWTEIAQAIKNWTRFTPESEKMRQEWREQGKRKVAEDLKAIKKEMLEAGLNPDKYSSFISDMVDVYYQDGKKAFISVGVDLRTARPSMYTLSPNGSSNGKYYVGIGHLKEALEAMKTFMESMHNLQ